MFFGICHSAEMHQIAGAAIYGGEKIALSLAALAGIKGELVEATSGRALVNIARRRERSST